MLKNFIKKEIIISEKLETYINEVVDSIDMGITTCRFDLVPTIERDRKYASREAILALIMRCKPQILQIDSISNGPKRNIDSKMLEKMINYTLLGILKTCQDTIEKARHDYFDCETSQEKSPLDLEMEKRFKEYYEHLIDLIIEKEELLHEMAEDSYVPFNFEDEKLITCKTSFRFLNKPTKKSTKD